MNNNTPSSHATILRAIGFVFLLLQAGITSIHADNPFWANREVKPNLWRGIGGELEVWLLTYDESGLDDYIRWLDIYAESGGKEELIFKMWGEHGKNEYGSRYEFPANNSEEESVTVRVNDEKKVGSTYRIKLRIWLPSYYWGMARLRFHGRFAYEKNNDSGVNFNFVKEVEAWERPRFFVPEIVVADFSSPNQFQVQLRRMFFFSHCENKLYNSVTKKEILRTEGTASTYTERVPITPNTIDEMRYTLSFRYGTNTYDHHIDIPIPRMREPRDLIVNYSSDRSSCRLQWSKTGAGKREGEKWVIFRRHGTENNWRSQWERIASLQDTDTLWYTDADSRLLPGEEYTYAVSYYRNNWGEASVPDDTFEGGSVSAVVGLPSTVEEESEIPADTTVVPPVVTPPETDASRPPRYGIAAVVVAVLLLIFLGVYLWLRRRKGV